MVDNVEKEIMLKFLKRSYPVLKIKDNKRFKRCIVLDDGVRYFISDEKQHISLRLKLLEIIKNVFHCTHSISHYILNHYLKAT
jgi:hypothetical protein